MDEILRGTVPSYLHAKVSEDFPVDCDSRAPEPLPQNTWIIEFSSIVSLTAYYGHRLGGGQRDG